MADWLTSYNWMMDNEDRRRLCAIVDDPSDSDLEAKAISGINSAAFPGEYEAIAALAQNERGLAVEQFYHRHFWNSFIAQLPDSLAKRVLDMTLTSSPRMNPGVLRRFFDNNFGEGRCDPPTPPLF